MIKLAKPLVTTMLLGLFAAPVLAQTAAEPPLASPLTFNEAIAIALEAQPGTIAEVALDRLDGKVIIDIEVVNEAGEEVEFTLDAQSGEILRTWVDDDPTNDPGEGAETNTGG